MKINTCQHHKNKMPDINLIFTEQASDAHWTQSIDSWVISVMSYVYRFLIVQQLLYIKKPSDKAGCGRIKNHSIAPALQRYISIKLIAFA